jgi:hypothetical protein
LRFLLRAAQDHEVIGIAYHLQSCLGDLPIQVIQIDVG